MMRLSVAQAQLIRRISQSHRRSSSDAPLTALIDILRLPLSARTPKTVQALLDFIKDANFFKKLTLEAGEEVASQCCQAMSYELVPENEFVFHQGDHGTKFYVILHGECSVLILSEGEFTEVRRLAKGDCFGELGLIDNKPRAASVLCRRETHFAVLGKRDYVQILAKAQGHFLNAKMDFLMSLPIFTRWTNWAMHKLAYCFREKTFRWRQVVCKRGESIAEVIIIRSGEAQMQKEISCPTPQQSLLMSPKSVKRHYEVALLRTGEMLGQEDEAAYQYTVVCHSEVMVTYVISKEDFRKYLNSEDTMKLLANITKAKKQLHEGETDQERQRVRHYVHSPKHRPSLSASEVAKCPPAVSFALVPRLYPKPLNKTVSSISSPHRQRSWDQILALKSNQSRLGKSHSALNCSKVVNIHTQRLRTADKLAESMIISRSANVSPLSKQRNPVFMINSVKMTNAIAREWARPIRKRTLAN